MPKLGTTGTADLSSLPEDLAAQYAGYFTDVNNSKYSDFVSTKKSGFTIGYSDSFAGNEWRQKVLGQLQTAVDSLKSSGEVTDLIAANSNLDNNLQIQQITSMINQKVDAIIAIPGSPTAFDAVIKQAYDAGIPFITLASHVDSPYALNVDVNYFGTGVDVATGLANLIGKKGSIVIVDGINGAPASQALHDGYLAALANCPDITVAGSVEGKWNEAVTKTAMLQYLASNPADVDGVINGGGEAIGVIQALEETKRPLVPIGDASPDKGTLVQFAKKLPNEYAASTLPSLEMANAGLLLALGTLLGYQPKFDAVVGNPGLITGEKALSSWVDTSWDENDSSPPPLPEGTDFLSPSTFASFFAKPGNLPTLPTKQ